MPRFLRKAGRLRVLDPSKGKLGTDEVMNPGTAGVPAVILSDITDGTGIWDSAADWTLDAGLVHNGAQRGIDSEAATGNLVARWDYAATQVFSVGNTYRVSGDVEQTITDRISITLEVSTKTAIEALDGEFTYDIAVTGLGGVRDMDIEFNTVVGNVTNIVIEDLGPT